MTNREQKICLDQMGEQVILNHQPKRIISLVPSQTELLFDLGLNQEIVGITKFCVHPKDGLKLKTKVGGTKSFKFDVIDKLAPDLIIGNKEENYKEGILKLKEKYPVWMSDIFNLQDACQMILSIGEILERDKKANDLVGTIQYGFERLKMRESSFKKVLYLIWKGPYMAAGKNTFIDSIISELGWKNVINENRYPEITADTMRALAPDIVFLSSEPYPFKQKHFEEINNLLPLAEVKLVDGEMFSWYGSRLKLAVEYFEKLTI